MSNKLSFDAAAEVMRAADLEPLEDYPGKGARWKCRCLKCGRIVSPHYSSVQQGRKGCAYCAGRRVDSAEALKMMLRANLQPLEDFPGAKKKWKSRCLKCQANVYPTYSNIKSGSGGCKGCAGLLVDPENARKLYESCGLKPLEDYPGSGIPWAGICLKCWNHVSPRYSDLKNGKSKGCKFCAGSAVSADAALSFMESKGFKTDTPYPGGSAKWKGFCTTCNNEIFPMYSTVKFGQGICKFCAGRALSARDANALFRAANLVPMVDYSFKRTKIQCKCKVCQRTVLASLYGLAQGFGGCSFCAGIKVDAIEADLIMKECGFEPLVPYPGAKSPWESRCNKCKKITRPTFGNVSRLGTGCRYCNSHNGFFDGSRPALLYLISHLELGSHKIGVTGKDRKTDRLAAHQAFGWKVYRTIEFVNGGTALDIEQSILDWFKSEFNLAPYLSRVEMPQGGATETVDASEIDLPTIWAKVEELSQVKR